MALSHTEAGTRTLQAVLEKLEVADKRHRFYRQRWEHFYALYRGFTDWTNTVESNTPRDVYNGIREAQREWGAELFIPRTFATVETIVPRMLSNRPRMLVLPRRKAFEENAAKMRFLLDAQQEQIHYELKLQETSKAGIIYGLGVQKVAWDTRKRTKRTLAPPTFRTKDGPEYVEGEPEEHVIFDDPNVWDVDPFDFLWDPMADSLENARYLFHRTWRDTDYCWGKIQCGDWKPQVVTPLEAGDIDATGPSPGEYESVWRARMRALGHTDPDRAGSQVHEVLEFHDGRNVITILDRALAANEGENPAWHGEYPFVIFRPQSSGTKQLPGIGEVEPIEHLQLELNALRSRRADNATMKLNAPIAFREGLVDPADLQWAPGMAIPMRGDPREAVMQLLVGDIPNSGYQEEQALQGDIEITSGISDSTTGADTGAAQTATGIQLVQAAANMRIQNKTRRAEQELAQPAAVLFVELNQQMILKSRELMDLQPPSPGEADRRWSWVELSPNDLKGEFLVMAEGGSTAPENVAQMRSDAQLGLQLIGSPLMQFLDPMKLTHWVLENLGVQNPSAWIRDQSQQLPPGTLEAIMAHLVQAGMPQQAAHGLLQQAVGDAQQQAQGGQEGQPPEQQGPPSPDDPGTRPQGPSG